MAVLTMNIEKMKFYFHCLAWLAVILLWGIGFLNGTVQALILAVWDGQLGEEKLALATNYTGIQLIDYPIAIIVAFFFYGTNGHDEGYQLFLLDAYATLQSAFVWLYVESLRPHTKPKSISRPVVFGLLWQCFGAAIALPLYYSLHLQWVSQDRQKITRATSLDQARALPFAFLLGAVLPTLIGMAPTWLGPHYREASVHQSILAFWQPDPIWVSWTLGVLALLPIKPASWPSRRRLGSLTHEDQAEDRRKAHGWICTSYLLAATSSALGHFYVLGRILTSDNPAVNVSRMYVPRLCVGPSGEAAANILVRGPWLFLQYDFIIISLSSVSWAYFLVGPKTPAGHLFGVRLALIMFAASVIIGPGAVVSLALLVREHRLPEHYKERVVQ